MVAVGPPVASAACAVAELHRRLNPRSASRGVSEPSDDLQIDGVTCRWWRYKVKMKRISKDEVGMQAALTILASCFALACDIVVLYPDGEPPATCFRLLPRRQASRYDIATAADGGDIVAREDDIQLCGVS